MEFFCLVPSPRSNKHEELEAKSGVCNGLWDHLQRQVGPSPSSRAYKSGKVIQLVSDIHGPYVSKVTVQEVVRVKYIFFVAESFTWLWQT